MTSEEKQKIREVVRVMRGKPVHFTTVEYAKDFRSVHVQAACSRGSVYRLVTLNVDDVTCMLCIRAIDKANRQ